MVQNEPEIDRRRPELVWPSALAVGAVPDCRATERECKSDDIGSVDAQDSAQEIGGIRLARAREGRAERARGR